MPPQSTLLLAATARSIQFPHHKHGTRALATAVHKFKSVGIRREDKSRWERRAPLTPEAVERLIKETGARVYVQPNSNAAPGNSSTRGHLAGATIQEDLSPADIILGIKEVPIPSLLPDKTYMYFSHTHKGQHYNMPMLQNVLDKVKRWGLNHDPFMHLALVTQNVRLIDYELMTDAKGKRVIAFGKFAGYAGMIDGFHGLGNRLLGLEHSTPFLNIAMSHTYRSLASARLAVQAAGNAITDEGTPKEFGPMTMVFTGGGNVSQRMPHEYVDPKDLKKIVEDKNARLNKIYATEVNVQDYLRHKDTGSFLSHEDYYANPQNYVSDFHTQIAPYATMVVNGAYWDARCPRMLTTTQLAHVQRAAPERMIALADISCDIQEMDDECLDGWMREGAFEFTSHSTPIDDAFYYVDATKGVEHKDVESSGTQVMAIDILPTELPLESSQHFGAALLPYVREMVKSHHHENATLHNATIAEAGKLAPKHEALYALLGGGGTPGVKVNVDKTPAGKKNVLLLGSGFVARPLVDYLLRQGEARITIGECERLLVGCLATGDNLAQGRPDTNVVGLDVDDKESLGRLVSGADVVVSLVPAFLHPKVAQACIDHRTHMVTASYVSADMRKLDESAKAVGITIMNEIGLDPGIDHLSAMKLIDEVQGQGGKITSFVSWCGGLPAPEVSDVPLAYKFSWSPRGVLTAGMNDARFWMGGKVVIVLYATLVPGVHVSPKLQTIPGENLLRHHFPTVPIPFPGFAFEGLANRDSLTYVDAYKLGPIESMDTMLRGTLRYRVSGSGDPRLKEKCGVGYADLMYAFRRLGLLNTDIQAGGRFGSWMTDSLLGLSSGMRHSDDTRISAVADKLDLPKSHAMVGTVVEALRWCVVPLNIDPKIPIIHRLSLLPTALSISSPAAPATPTTALAPLDAFCGLLSHKLQYNAGERDMVVLHHEFGIRARDGREETRTSTLISYGSFESYTAMAKTVGLPAAMAAEMIIRGVCWGGTCQIPERGVLTPTMPHVYNPILEGLETEGVRMVEKTVSRAAGASRPAWGGNGVWK
ncbi:Saccharopine dehydrogenase-domain-containing protein [Jimgerdemannia flammicorona]|uniref:Saccharopine dehydrogenase-domain-containing protein n=1 Tax=Jimgerdemannia flammicorona TaxID=994334 RepID=A0A433QFU2_9FUNG|nr:Saccharopine dehydrogenase-domain-containing protein [Jimgerdemannia flammicorona]